VSADELLVVLRLAEMGLTTLDRIMAAAKSDGATAEQIDAARADLLARKARRQAVIDNSAGPGGE
jgi:hypothetical protein